MSFYTYWIVISWEKNVGKRYISIKCVTYKQEEIHNMTINSDLRLGNILYTVLIDPYSFPKSLS